MWGFGAALEPQRGAGQGDGAVKAGTAESTRETAAPRQMESSEHSQGWDEPARNSVGQRGRTTAPPQEGREDSTGKAFKPEDQPG